MRGIGIAVRETAPGEQSFLPGLAIRNGAIVIDPARWVYPGDILHEAGHLAVVPRAERAVEALEPTATDEMAAIAWSYAAAVHLGLAADIVFHADGYRGGGSSYARSFAEGGHFGTPVLAYYGMTIEPRRASTGGLPPYPHMLRWLR